MLTRLRSFLLFIFVLVSFHASAITLSDSARISLLTCSPGDELYSCFGHSGIRVTDYRQGFDVVFNYGTFDFGDLKVFVYNFLKGHMIYMVAVDRYQDFNAQYVYEQRSIYEQEIHLADSDRVRLFDFLATNALPENRDYRYDFLYDNCATRIREVFQKNVPAIHFDYSTFKDQKSFRTLINDYSDNQPWLQFGMGLLIGLPVDKVATPEQETFLPDYLSSAFAHATVAGQPLCGPKMTILDIKASPADTWDKKITPNIVFGILLIIVLLITYFEFKRSEHFYFIDCLLFFLAGVLGTLFLVLGGFTEHTTTQWNLNLMWALPTHLVMAFFAPFAKNKPWVRNYFLVAAVLALVVAVGGKLLPQKFLLANILIAAVFAVRSYSIYRSGLQKT